MFTCVRILLIAVLRIYTTACKSLIGLAHLQVQVLSDMTMTYVSLNINTIEDDQQSPHIVKPYPNA